MLYGLLALDKQQLFKLLAQNKYLQEDYDHYFRGHGVQQLETTLLEGASDLPDAYYKVYKSYLMRRNRSANDNHTKQLMKAKIEQLQLQKNVSNYRVYTSLHLNPGNYNDFIRNNRLEKLSLENARKVLSYLTTETSHQKESRI